MTTARLLITAGPTHEPIDEVRYLANRSSGRMGIAMADAAAARGWPVTLLLGPTHRRPNSADVELHRFSTAAELGSLISTHWPRFDLLIMAAAVADFRPARTPEAKMSRTDGPVTLELEPTEDLLAAAASQSRPEQRLIGFALEPADRLLESARDKLRRKRLHAIVANPLDTMDAERATAHLILAGGDVLDAPADLTKPDLAEWLLDAIAAHVLPGAAST